MKVERTYNGFKLVVVSDIDFEGISNQDTSEVRWYFQTGVCVIKNFILPKEEKGYIQGEWLTVSAEMYNERVLLHNTAYELANLYGEVGYADYIIFSEHEKSKEGVLVISTSALVKWEN